MDHSILACRAYECAGYDPATARFILDCVLWLLIGYVGVAMVYHATAAVVEIVCALAHLIRRLIP